MYKKQLNNLKLYEKCASPQIFFITGLIFHESEAQAVLCKPKLLPLKSFTLEKLEKMQKEATAKAQETILEKQREDESQFYPGGNTGICKHGSMVSSYVHKYS